MYTYLAPVLHFFQSAHDVSPPKNMCSGTAPCAGLMFSGTNMYSRTNLFSGAIPYALPMDQRKNNYEYVTNISCTVDLPCAVVNTRAN